MKTVRNDEDLVAFLREEGLFITPPGGGWVTIHGNRGMVPQGLRIQESLRALGFRHMDIRWAVNERLTESPGYPKYGYPVEFESERHELLDILYDEIAGYGSGHKQVTIMDIAHPGTAKACMYNGEVTATSENLIADLLAENCLEVVRFEQESPMWEEATRDVMDSLRVDGLSFAEAQAEVMSLGLLRVADRLIAPGWYYKPIGWYYHNFCEEPEREALIAAGLYTPPIVPQEAFA